MMTANVVQCQFYPDGSAVDLLSLNRQTLQPVTHPALGRCVTILHFNDKQRPHIKHIHTEAVLYMFMPAFLSQSHRRIM